MTINYHIMIILFFSILQSFQKVFYYIIILLNFKSIKFCEILNKNNVFDLS